MVGAGGSAMLDELLVGVVGIHDGWVGEELGGISCVFVIALAGRGVDEDGAGLGNLGEVVERVAGEEGALLFADAKGLEAVAAGACPVAISVWAGWP